MVVFISIKAIFYRTSAMGNEQRVFGKMNYSQLLTCLFFRQDIANLQ